MSKSGQVANLVVIGLGIFVVYHSYYYLKLGILIAPGAGFLPFLCGLALVALAVIGWFANQMVKAQHRQRADKPTPSEDGRSENSEAFWEKGVSTLSQ